MASPMEVRPGWTKYAWMNPLAKWNKEVGRTRTIARTVKQIPVSDTIRLLPPGVVAASTEITE